MNMPIMGTFAAIEPEFVDPSLWYLVAGLVALLAGPLLHQIASRSRSTLRALDGFFFVVITGLAVFHILPHAVEYAGWGSVIVAAAALLLPVVVERSTHKAAQRAHSAALWVAMVGIIAHAFMDGLALSGAGHADHGDEHGLSLAVVLHRIPDGLATWLLIRPRYGKKLALGVIFVLALSTIGGFLLGHQWVNLGTGMWAGYFEALVAGSLLHVVIHASAPAPQNQGVRWRSADGFGAIAGLILLAMMQHEPDAVAHSHPSDGPDLLGNWLALALETAPVLLLAYLSAGLLHAFFSDTSASWLRRGRPFTQALRGMAFGLPLPVCSCGIIPIYQSLIERRVPATAAMAFLVATPELGFDAVLLTIPLLGTDFTVARLVAAAVVALVVGWVVGSIAEKQTLAVAEIKPIISTATPLVTWQQKLISGVRIGFGDLVDKTGPWILFGLTVAALLVPHLDLDFLRSTPPGLDVLLFALIGMPTYVCASGATPLVAALVLKGVSPGAALAFLLAGPATNVVTFGVLSRLHGWRVAITFGALIVGLAVALGLIVNWTLPAPDVFAFQAHHHDSERWWSWAALSILGGLLLLSLLRQGPRRFANHILSLEDTGIHHRHADDDHHKHPHTHDHDHEHGHESECHNIREIRP